MQGYLKILHSVFHLFTVFSAFEKVGQRFQVQSRIIASSVQPPVEKLVEPVVIVFGGVKVTILARVKFIPFWAMPIEKWTFLISRGKCYLLHSDPNCLYHAVGDLSIKLCFSEVNEGFVAWLVFTNKTTLSIRFETDIKKTRRATASFLGPVPYSNTTKMRHVLSYFKRHFKVSALIQPEMTSSLSDSLQLYWNRLFKQYRWFGFDLFAIFVAI